MAPVSTNKLIRDGLTKGCLGGLGLAVLFMVISGLTHLVLLPTGIPIGFHLVLTILSGPILGTFGLLALLLQRSRKALTNMTSSPKSKPE